jgi:hypothetical protein
VDRGLDTLRGREIEGVEVRRRAVVFEGGADCSRRRRGLEQGLLADRDLTGRWGIAEGRLVVDPSIVGAAVGSAQEAPEEVRDALSPGRAGR